MAMGHPLANETPDELLLVGTCGASATHAGPLLDENVDR